MDSGLLALALVAGAVAAFNPCGFALLPAYLTILVAQTPPGTEHGDSAASSSVVRAVRFSLGMTVGFVATFGLVGLIVTPLTLSFERYLPIVTVLVGVGLVALGIWLLLGHSLGIPGLAGRGRGPTRSWLSQVGYGITFALASLSCTIAPFLAVTSTALRAGYAASALAAYIAYALGMGTVVLVLALAFATASAGFAARMRRASPVITRFSGGLLVLAGLYVAWYGWFEIRVLSGQSVGDPIVAAVIDIQGRVTRLVVGLRSTTLLLVTVMLIIVVCASIAISRRRSSVDRPSAG